MEETPKHKLGRRVRDAWAVLVGRRSVVRPGDKKSPKPKPVKEKKAEKPPEKKPSRNPSLDYDIFEKWMLHEGPYDSAIDIGAFVGEYVKILSGPFGIPVVHAIEPQADRAEGLGKLELANTKLHVHPVALWDSNGTQPFIINEHAPASSILRCHQFQTTNMPRVKESETVEVKTVRLDDLMEPYDLGERFFIKMDAQGAEDRIIKGGWNTFSRAKMVMVEISYVPMYVDQPLFQDIHELLTQCGMIFAGFKNQIHSKNTGEAFFAHVLYKRP